MCRVLSVPVTTMVARKVGTSPSSVELPTAVVPDVSGGGGGGGGKAPPGPGESGDASSAGSPSSSCSWPCSSSSVSSSSGSSSCAFFLPLPFLPILAGRPTHRRRGLTTMVPEWGASDVARLLSAVSERFICVNVNTTDANNRCDGTVTARSEYTHLTGFVWCPRVSK